MNYQRLGSTGVKISRLGLGCGNFGGIGSAPAFYGMGETEAQAAALLDRAWDAGINLLDTADAYGGGRSEQYIGNWLRARGSSVRDRLVVSAADPEAAVGLDKEKVLRPLYNVQVLDDLDSPFVLGYEVFAQPNDAGLLGALLRRTRESVGHGLQAVLVDPAYAGGADLRAAAVAGVTVYARPPREARGRQLPRSAFTWLAHTRICGGRPIAARSRKNAAATVVTPPESPSILSSRFSALVIPTTQISVIAQFIHAVGKR